MCTTWYGCLAPLLIAVTLAGPAFGLLLELAALELELEWLL